VSVALFMLAWLVVLPASVGAADAFRALDLIRPSRAKAAPEFTLSGLGGERITLRELKGKVVFLNFWATWCPPCKEEMPSMERLYRRYKERGFTILAVSIDAGGERAVRDFVKAHGLTFLIGLDPKLEVANLYTVRALPSTFVIDRSGNTAAVALGPRDWDGAAAHAVIESLLK
jgi:peroxiredoxin